MIIRRRLNGRRGIGQVRLDPDDTPRQLIRRPASWKSDITEGRRTTEQ